MENYKLLGDTFIIQDYDKMPPFTSFLPGLSGVRGIPLWLFYVNRGQGITSFGIHNKNNAIMEFNPANAAYENTAVKGFRTFLKIDDTFYEPFEVQNTDAKRTMYIKKNSLEIEEINESLGIRVNVTYFILPNETIGAIVRDVRITNLTSDTRRFEVLDGMPKIIPYGISNSSFKEVSNLMKSWTDIRNLEHQIPFITMRASSDDSAEVSEVEGGYYYLSIESGKVVPIIYDAEAVFSYDTTLIHPIEFKKKSFDTIDKISQCFANKVPCGFTSLSKMLICNQELNFTSYIGFANTPELVNEKVIELTKEGYAKKKREEADALAELFTQDVKTNTALKVFDQYIEQCYLDNFLRGGYPYVFGKKENPQVVHLFSRKHGDPERDYNFFSIAGEFYSQGNGNFRDVCQNRRSDVFFKKEIGNFNIKSFLQLIQADGYNPLEIRPTTFVIKEEKLEELVSFVKDHTQGENEKLISLLKEPFTPGRISNCMYRYHIESCIPEEELMEVILEDSVQQIEAGFGEGYWSDHWDYTMDLIEDYVKIYPEKVTELLFGDETYRFYDSPCYVLPRSEKYVVAKNGIRQYGAEIFDEEKCQQEGFLRKGTNWMKDKSGEIVHTTLFVKMLSLALNKFATLDPYGMGVEMEGGKPGWNDAMNGLPGLFGSGMAETFELKRLLNFLRNHVGRVNVTKLLIQIWEYLTAVAALLEAKDNNEMDDFKYWDGVASIREEYRFEVRFTMDSEVLQVNTEDIESILTRFLEKVECGIKRALHIGKGIVPTYFTYEVSDYSTVTDENGDLLKTHYGLPRAIVHGFQMVALPLFLEGPARMLGTMEDMNAAKDMCIAIKESELYDKQLKMYKTSVPIEHISMEHGRIRAFTAGWLERESIFLHMEYKYLLSMLKVGLYEEFFEEIKTTLIPFLPPKRYGRSILENSSFIASSENPDASLHGRGFVSRLSGSTTEMISMWIRMFAGDQLFAYENGELQLTLSPKLADYFFDEDGYASFMFLSNCLITYKNVESKPTYGENGAKIVSIQAEDGSFETKGNVLRGEFAKAVRDGKVKGLLITMK